MDFFKPAKSPLDTLPFGFAFSDWLAQNAVDDPALIDDTIVSAVMSATPEGLTVGAASISGANVVATVSGGTDQTTYTLSCTITTAMGLIAAAEQVIYVRHDAR